MDLQKFYDGTAFDAYNYFGAHPAEDGKGIVFRTFALNADKVSLIGEFSDWKELPMKNPERYGFWDQGGPGRPDVQVCHLFQTGPDRALRSLRLRHGTAAQLGLYRTGPV